MIWAISALAVLGLWGVLDFLLVRIAAWAIRRAQRRTLALRFPIRRPPSSPEIAARHAPLRASNLAEAAHLLSMAYAASRSLQEALRSVADLDGAPLPLRARAAWALARMREGKDPEEAFRDLPRSPEEGRLWRVLAAVWTAPEETVRRTLRTFEEQMRRRARLADEARSSLLPFRAIAWILRAGIIIGAIAPVIPIVREGWASVPGGWALYALLVTGGVITDRLIATAVRTFEEALE